MLYIMCLFDVGFGYCLMLVLCAFCFYAGKKTVNVDHHEWSLYFVYICFVFL